MGRQNMGISTARGFMARFARDARANTMAIMAAAMIPLAGLIGGAVDVSRLYIVKTRLQHACDAGALAGRKAMGGGTWNQTVNNVANYPNLTATTFFDANIAASPYGATSVTRSFAESGGKVTGTVSATLPMTLMQIFGQGTQTINVVCDAEMRLPNTDVMFVLDTTGSMGDTPTGDTMTKIASLKIAVKCFYEIVAKLDTDANCTTGTPSGGTGNQVQIRFGFMPYATNVNVGHLLPSTYFANSWKYQSREPQWNTSTTTTYSNPAVDSSGSPGSGNSGWTTPTTVSSGFFYCPNQPADQNNVSGTFTVDTAVTTDANGVKTWSTRTYTKYNIDYSSSWSGWYCNITSSQQGTGNYTVVNHTQTPVTTTVNTFKQWHYGQISQNISGLKNGTGWVSNYQFTLPIGSNGTNKTITWDGCIEERRTVSQSSYSPIPSTADDLNIDEVPDQSNANTLWAPALPDVIYTRNDPGGYYGGSGYWSTADAYTTSDYVNSSNYYCPTEAKKLQAWTDPSLFDAYVDSLTPNGNTYHDIGLLWGARFLSPTGIFASENATTPQGGDIQRHMIFMTDGDPCTDPRNYNAYGVNWYDKRTTGTSTLTMAQNCTSGAPLTDQVNARVEALCTAIKNKNITLWVITFGAVATETQTRMTNCASPGKYFSANNAAQIQSTFKSIADQISQLRLTR